MRYYKLLNLKWQDNTNTGDAVCSPCPYFPALRGADVAHLNHEWAVRRCDEYEAVILGGGLLNEEHVPTIRRVIARARKVIFWAVGTNSLNADWEPPDLRAPNAFGWWRHENPYFPVGCDPSCLHPLLDWALFHRGAMEKRPADIVRISHKDHPVAGAVLDNGRELRELLTEIADARRVVTNSYHVAYWCHLLGTPAEIEHPWSTKLKPEHRAVFERIGPLESHRALAGSMYQAALEFIGS